MRGSIEIPKLIGGFAYRRLNPRETVNRGKGRFPMIDILIALLLGSLKISDEKPPAGGIPVPPTHTTGAGSFH